MVADSIKFHKYKRKNTCINSMEMNTFLTFVMILVSVKKDTCVKSIVMNAMIDIPHKV